MIGAFIILASVLQDRPATLDQDPDVVLSRVFQKYYNAKTLSGTIVQSISDGGGTKKITTLISYQRPNKIYVQQDFVHPNGLKANLTSDGRIFAYDPPLKLKAAPRERLYEQVELPRQGTSNVTYLQIGDMYHAAHTSLAPSTLLDLAIAHTPHLKDYKINVATHKLAGIVELQGKKAYNIVGTWRIGLDQTPMGNFEILISTEYDLLRFILREIYQLPDGRKVNVTTTEVADLKVDVAVNQELFKVILPRVAQKPPKVTTASLKPARFSIGRGANDWRAILH